MEPTHNSQEEHPDDAAQLHGLPPAANNPPSENTNPPEPASTSAKSHYGMSQRKLSSIGRKLLDDIEFDENEEMVCEIRKHPIGLIMIYVFGTFVTGGLLLATLTTSLYLRGDPFGTGSSLETFRPVFIVLGFLMTIFSAVVTTIAAFLYRNSVILVTNEKIAQLLYITLFNRKISQLSIGDLQDVTVKQKGIFPHLFNYGTLIIETAGEQQNYTFTFTPFPYHCSKEIVGAHERNLQKYGN